MSARLAALMLGVILLLGTVVRCDHLSDRTVWFDEAFSYTLVTRFSPSEILARTALDVHPPLYYFVLWAWTRCCGVSSVALRAPSVLLGVATIALGYLVARDALSRGGQCEDELSRGRAAGVACAALIATSAVHVRWSWEARMYSLATALLLGCLWCALRALDSPPKIARYWWAGFFGMATAMLYTHNYGLFSFLGICVWLILEMSRSGEGWQWPWKAPVFWPALVAVVAVGWAYLPWIPVLLAQKAQVQEDYWIPPIGWLTLPRAWYSLIVPTNVESHLSDAAAAGFGVLLLGIAGIFFLRFQRIDRLAMGLWLTPVVIAVVISVVSVPVIVDRHFLLAHLCVLIGVAGLVAWTAPSICYWGLVGLLAMDGLMVVQAYRNQLDVAAKPGIRGAIADVLARRQPDEPILVLHPCIYFSARYYVGEQAAVQMYVPPDRVMHYTGAPIVTEDDFFPIDAIDGVAGKRLWVLDTDGFAPGSTGMIIPSDWTARKSTRFPDVYQFQGSVTVTMYERRQPELQRSRRASTTTRDVNMTGH